MEITSGKPLMKIDRTQHREKSVLTLSFEYNPNLIGEVKGAKARWSKTLNTWYFFEEEENLAQIFEKFKLNFHIDYSSLKAQKTFAALPYQKPNKLPINLNSEAKNELAKFEDILQSRRYSQNTVGSYKSSLEVFFSYFQHKAIADITNEDVNYFMHNYMYKRGYSEVYQRQIIGALKLFFARRMGVSLDLEKVETPRRRRSLPKVLSIEEISKMLNCCTNIKHKTMISLQYGCGLRVGELVSLTPYNIDSTRGVLNVISGKGKKDRRIKLPSDLVDLLRTYYKAYRPKVYLFEGQHGGMYSTTSINKYLKNYAERAKINKSINSHMLRHSYATHLLENGVDLRYIQELLGHSSSKTTEIYTFVSSHKLTQIPSPFDFLNKKEK